VVVFYLSGLDLHISTYKHHLTIVDSMAWETVEATPAEIEMIYYFIPSGISTGRKADT
jgi:hypothetical protein